MDITSNRRTAGGDKMGINDRERVIKGLECCITDGTDCPDDCPYIGDCNRKQLHTDALALLKSQEPIKPQARFNPAGQPMWCCGNCGTTLFFKFPRQTDDEDKRNEHRFCNYCGKKVKWDD